MAAAASSAQISSRGWPARLRRLSVWLSLALSSVGPAIRALAGIAAERKLNVLAVLMLAVNLAGSHNGGSRLGIHAVGLQSAHGGMVRSGPLVPARSAGRDGSIRAGAPVGRAS